MLWAEATIERSMYARNTHACSTKSKSFVYVHVLQATKAGRGGLGTRLAGEPLTSGNYVTPILLTRGAYLHCLSHF